ncbi:MHYT domain-containing protein [Kitasatospora sp. NPDC005751]|uniref:MHYT domain-containing protein n=1 Tax=Kitasatospora sp. NPDC005751 TaxID=3157064 RepID=UPI0033FB7880
MGTTSHLGSGWVTPALSCVVACALAALGLRRTLRGLAATGAARRNRLLTAAAAIGSGIWTMDVVAMSGFTPDGAEACHGVPAAVLGLPVAVLVTGPGVCAVGYGRRRGPALLAGGVITGLGIAAVHYLDLAALRTRGGLRFDPGTVALSVLVAVGAATGSLWAVVTLCSAAAETAASLVMGLAVSCLHCARTAAVPARAGLDGTDPMEFVLPLAVGTGSFLFLAAAFAALSPPAPDRAARREASELTIEEFPAAPARPGPGRHDRAA